MSQSTRFANLSPCSGRRPRACRARRDRSAPSTMFEPMKPAAPVTTIYMRCFSLPSAEQVRAAAQRRCRTCRPRCRRRDWRRARLRPSDSPPASMTASVAMTVSPAPVTSDTSRACAGTCRRRASSKQRHAILAPRVTSSASSFKLTRAAAARARVCSRSLLHAPDHVAEFVEVRRDHAWRPGSAQSRRPWDRPAPACRPLRAARSCRAMCVRPPLP